MGVEVKVSDRWWDWKPGGRQKWGTQGCECRRCPEECLTGMSACSGSCCGQTRSPWTQSLWSDGEGIFIKHSKGSEGLKLKYSPMQNNRSVWKLRINYLAWWQRKPVVPWQLDRYWGCWDCPRQRCRTSCTFPSVVCRETASFAYSTKYSNLIGTKTAVRSTAKGTWRYKHLLLNNNTYHVTPRDLSCQADRSQCAKEVKSSVQDPGTIPKASECPVVVQSPFSSELWVKTQKHPSHTHSSGLEETTPIKNSSAHRLGTSMLMMQVSSSSPYWSVHEARSHLWSCDRQ